MSLNEHPPARSRANTRARLIGAAAEVFAERGLGETSVEMICERAGFTRGAFYSNFTSKEDLFLALTADFIHEHLASLGERIRAFTTEHAGQGLSGDELAAALTDVLGGVVEDRTIFVLDQELRTQALRDPELAASYVDLNTALRQQVTPMIEQVCVARDLQPTIAPRHIADMLIGIWSEATVHMMLTDGDRATRDEAVARLVHVIFDAADHASVTTR